MRSMLKNEDLGKLIREQRLQQEAASDREKELNIYRSGSAPPTVEGSLSSIGGLFDATALPGIKKSNKGGFLSEEEIRSDPAKGSRGGDNEGNRSLFAVQPGFGEKTEENGNGTGGGVEWGGDGLIGLPGLGLGSRQKSIAEIIQDDMDHAYPISRHPSRPASRNAYDDNVETSESQFAQLHDLASAEALRSVSNKQGIPVVPNVGATAHHSYASALGVSSSLDESAEFVAALSGLNLSPVDVENHSRSQSEHNIDDHHDLYNLHGDQNHVKQQSFLNKSNSYANSLKGPSTPAFNGRGGSPSDLQSADNMNSPFSSYGLSGYSVNPSSPSMMGSHLGSGSLLPLFENVAAASAVGGTGLDSRALSALGPNFMATTAELQNLSRVGNRSAGNALQMPLMDPLYLQYLRSNEYAAAQLGALNEPCIDREYLGNSYLDLLQKAYLGTLLSPQKSPYGVPYLGKSGSLNQNYYGNPSIWSWHVLFWEPNRGSLLPNSPIGSGSPVRHSERNMRFTTGMRNLSGVLWDLGTQNLVAIEVVELDQQTKMVTELDGHIMRCVRDQNGNHVIQKCIECVPEDAIQFIVSTFYDQVVTLSTHPYGCRVIQRVLEHCHNTKTQHIMMHEILQSVCMLAQDQYGNYVVQHVLEHGKPHERSAIIKKLTGQIVQMSQQKFASNVIEKCLTFGTPAECQALVNEMLGTTDENEPLQCGNMLRHPLVPWLKALLRIMLLNFYFSFILLLFFNQQMASHDERSIANYVVQKVLETCDDQQLELILNRIKVHLNALKKYTYGKHIVARVEKLVAAGVIV
ncbi:hypothetical protein GH714_036131 [Hevea brasiliensis]|uniref:PUM-HD domain-containing protein n=1 Tax=Hevea brasiliensis TaxID=3981 RepID=A0A6A6L7Q3_HEVBR|nr:hypothetical protein GH714_036131 [Hevea brasiliensis]